MQKCASVIVLLAIAACDQGRSDPPPKPAAPPTDPANIAGTWSYHTESNCGSAGRGSVAFRWDAERGRYQEDGEVTWPDRELTIRWWGNGRFDAKARTLDVTVDNSLGDKVSGSWRLEGERPDQLVLDWHQTNGCHGVGTATRR